MTSPILVFCAAKLIIRCRRARQQGQADNNPANQRNRPRYLMFVWLMNIVLTITSAVYQILIDNSQGHEVKMQVCAFSLNR